MTAANWRERYTASVLKSYFEYMNSQKQKLKRFLVTTVIQMQSKILLYKNNVV